ncbi:14154_t:CDS:1, partial [Dentiscutata erythropus]
TPTMKHQNRRHQQRELERKTPRSVNTQQEKAKSKLQTEKETIHFPKNRFDHE